MLIQSQFKAPWWCRNPHLQTLVAARLRAIKAPSIKPERLLTPDNDFLDLHWFGCTDGPLVLIFHGLEGSSDSPYARGLMHALDSQNLGGAVMHFRGCSGEPNRQPQSYHCGHTEDIAWLLEQLAQRYPEKKLLAVGYSIGAAALLNTLAQENLPEQLTLSLAVSPPFEPRSGSIRMSQGFSRIYQHTLVQDCVLSARAKLAAGIKLPIDIDKLDTAKTFWQFDHHVTAPLHGFSSADDYYTRAAPRQRLSEIQRLCHIIHSHDDPFFEPSMIPNEDELGPKTTLELSRHGGHVGYVCGTPWRPNYWLEQRLTQLIRENLDRA
ncbi:MAG: hydrolase [Granulosicoccaceae bacterium]